MNPWRIVFLSLLAPTLLHAQEVRNTSYIASTGEKVLRLEAIVPVPKAEAWKLLTTEEGLRKWIAPVVSLDLKIGGQILTNYDSTRSAGDTGTIRLPILNFLDQDLVTLKVNLNDKFPQRVREQDRNLQEIIQIAGTGDGQTKITSSMFGWGEGPEWEKAYDFFARGNEWTFRRLIRALH